MSLLLNDKIEIVTLDNNSTSEIRQIDTRLRTLMLCKERTIPGSRRFGLPGNFLDEPVNTAENSLAIELQEKADIYVPEVKIESVKMEYDLYGKQRVTVHFERSDTSD